MQEILNWLDRNQRVVSLFKHIENYRREKLVNNILLGDLANHIRPSSMTENILFKTCLNKIAIGGPTFFDFVVGLAQWREKGCPLVNTTPNDPTTLDQPVNALRLLDQAMWVVPPEHQEKNSIKEEQAKFLKSKEGATNFLKFFSYKNVDDLLSQKTDYILWTVDRQPLTVSPIDDNDLLLMDTPIISMHAFAKIVFEQDICLVTRSFRDLRFVFPLGLSISVKMPLIEKKTLNENINGLVEENDEATHNESVLIGQKLLRKIVLHTIT